MITKSYTGWKLVSSNDLFRALRAGQDVRTVSGQLGIPRREAPRNILLICKCKIISQNTCRKIQCFRI